MKIRDRNIVHFKVQWPPGRAAREYQIFDDFALTIDRDRAAIYQVLEVDPMPLSGKTKVDAAMAHPFAAETVADSRFDHQVDGILLENSSPNPFDHIVTAPVLDNHGVDAFQVQKMPKQQSRRPCAYDPYLCAHGGHGD